MENLTSKELPSLSWFSVMPLKSCSHNSGTIPLFAPYPMTDQDLPEPVCPYANRVALKPFQALSSIPCPISLNTCFCENEKFINNKLQLGYLQC